MKKTASIIGFILLLSVYGIDSFAGIRPTVLALLQATKSIEMVSPNGEMHAFVSLSDQDSGVPLYRIQYKGQTIVTTSSLGLKLKDIDLTSDFEINSAHRQVVDTNYKIILGKASGARDHFQEYTIRLRQRSAPHRMLNIIFRLYDDGVAFRYTIPKQNSFSHVSLIREQTEFAFASDAKFYGLELGFRSAYESHYTIGRIAEFKSKKEIGLPIGVEFPHAYVELSEADIHGYTQSYLLPSSSGTFAITLPPGPEASVQGDLPFRTPWRTMSIGESPVTALQSNLITNLSPPSKIEDTSWIKSGKILFQWWNGYVIPGEQFSPPSAVLNEKTLKGYVDFCAQNSIPYVSLDGYEFDKAWYGGAVGTFDSKTQDVTHSAPDVRALEVIQYARQMGVGVRVWLHTDGLTDENMNTVLRTYSQWGVQAIMVDFMADDSQAGVARIENIFATAAKYHLMVALHGMAKPTGFQRTYPNYLTQEGVMNQEYNKWGDGDQASPHSDPDHEVLAAIIRGAVGPMDTHQGSMRPVPENRFVARPIAPNSIGTLAHQIANYVVYENPSAMLADYPQAYEQHADAFHFIQQVPSQWDETKVLQANLQNRVVTIARRNGDTWYIGSMTGRTRNKYSLTLDFLKPGKHYSAEIYQDTADSEVNGEALQMRASTVTSSDALTVDMAVGGGQAVVLRPID